MLSTTSTPLVVPLPGDLTLPDHWQDAAERRIARGYGTVARRQHKPAERSRHMDAKVAQRLAEVLTSQREEILERWATTVRETLRDRLTRVELDRQLAELYGALLRALDGG